MPCLEGWDRGMTSVFRTGLGVCVRIVTRIISVSGVFWSVLHSATSFLVADTQPWRAEESGKYWPSV